MLLKSLSRTLKIQRRYRPWYVLLNRTLYRELCGRIKCDEQQQDSGPVLLHPRPAHQLSLYSSTVLGALPLRFNLSDDLRTSGSQANTGGRRTSRLAARCIPVLTLSTVTLRSTFF